MLKQILKMENSAILRMFCDYQLKVKKINDKSMDVMRTDILTFILTIYRY
jgi:hypothetical protein